MGLNRNLGQLTEVIKELSGNIGIGASVPKEKLEVAGLVGNIRIYGRSGIAQNQITSNVYYNGSAWVRDTSAGAVAINLDSNSGSLGFFTTAATSGFPDERMRIFPSGNISIGSNPIDSVKLRVEDSGASSIMSLGTTTTTGRTTIDLLTNGYDWEIGARGSANSPANSFYIYNIDNSAYRLVISSGGNVAIGKQVPNAKLDVAGSIISEGSLIDNTAGNQQLSFRKNGSMRYAIGTEVGDGTTNDWSIYSYVAGSTSFLLYGNNNYKFYGTNLSDSRAKKEIKDLNFNFLDKVSELRPRSYYMKDNNGRLNYGFIAQEVHEVLPDLIGGDINGDEYIGLDYNGILPILVGAIKEQQEIIKQLENRIINLENK